MKKALMILTMGVLLTSAVSAQSDFTLNTRAWTTNYWTMTIYDASRFILSSFILDDEAYKATFERIVPSADLVFPVGIEKEGFASNGIYGAYHRAFANPFKRLGDFGVGLDASWHPGFLGVYAGAYFKSQELCFKNQDNLRSYYMQPRAGIVMGQKGALEIGAYYDFVVGADGSYGGSSATEKMFLDGLGLDFALSYKHSDNNRSLITFMLPLHNFLNEGYVGNVFSGMKRRVGYIMLTERISF